MYWSFYHTMALMILLSSYRWMTNCSFQTEFRMAFLVLPIPNISLITWIHCHSYLHDISIVLDIWLLHQSHFTAVSPPEFIAKHLFWSELVFPSAEPLERLLCNTILLTEIHDLQMELQRTKLLCYVHTYHALRIDVSMHSHTYSFNSLFQFISN